MVAHKRVQPQSFQQIHDEFSTTMAHSDESLRIVTPGPDVAEDGLAGRPPLPPEQTLSVLMPVYNECSMLGEIVNRVFASPVSVAIELIIVDDGSQDSSWEVAKRLSEEDPRIVAIRHPENRGKGAAVRTAIEHMTGDVAVIQDADLEYDPNDYPKLLEPILAGKADAVFGSRYAGNTRLVTGFWHTMVNRGLTLLSNVLNNLTLTDMETCYKMVRCDVLRQLRLRAKSFTLEPELACRLSQCGARIYEVPISYAGRNYGDGKKIRPIDGIKAIWAMFRCRFLDRRCTSDDIAEVRPATIEDVTSDTETRAA